jgi:hypothetical protein
MTDDITKVNDNDGPKPQSIQDMFKPKKWGIGAKKEAAKAAIAELNPEESEHRLGIVFDDSGSMADIVDDKSKIEHAQAGIRNFSHQCNPKDTSLAIYPLNKEAQKLTCNYDVFNMYVITIGPTGGTPLYTKTLQMLNECDITRGVLFSDGDPTDGSGYYSHIEDSENAERQSLKEQVIAVALAKKVPLDCIFIGYADTSGYNVMKELADRTDGTFIHFKDAKSLGAGLKYLAPALRGLLANPEIKQKIERGETI